MVSAGCLDILLDGDVLLLDLLLVLMSRLSFSLGAFLAAKGSLVWVLLDLFLDGDALCWRLFAWLFIRAA